MKNLISIKDLSIEEIEKIFSLAKQIKKKPHKFSRYLQGKSFALIFHKPSLRTRVSFETGIFQLGAKAVYLEEEIGVPVRRSLGEGWTEREAVKDIARVLSSYVEGVVIRTFSHQLLLDFAEYSTVPVINALTDLLHPCQVLSDLFTIKERKGDLKKVKIAYVGDGNNVCYSLIYGCNKTKADLNIATPLGYEPKMKIPALPAGRKNQKSPPKAGPPSAEKIRIMNNPIEAVKDADIIYTDVWTSMGKEEEKEERKKIFQNFQVNKKLVSYAKADCLIMHCLPAHRGEEITDEVIDGKNSIVFEQAENRLHLQKAILILLDIL